MLALLAVAAGCHAGYDDNDVPARFALDGSLRVGEWSGSRSLDQANGIATASVWSNAKVSLAEHDRIELDGWLATRDTAATRDGRVRELYWGHRMDDFDVRIGRQLILWGRADAINPTDNLTPRDFTVLTPADSDQRFGNLAANVTYHRGDYSLQAVWLARAGSDRIPLAALPMVRYGYRASGSSRNWALKLDHTGGAVDWSVSWYEGDDPLPDLTLAGIDSSGVEVALVNHRTRVLGADFSTSSGTCVERGEVAASRPDGASTQAFDRKHAQVLAVLGGECGFGEHFNVNAQYFLLRVPQFLSPDTLANPIARELAWRQAAIANQTASTQDGVSLRLAWDWANSTWQAEASGIDSFDNGGYVWRGKLSHSITDQVHLNLGIDRFAGPANSRFGMLRDNSLVYGELGYLF